MSPMWISLITTVVIRVPIAYGLAFITRSAEQPKGSPDSLFISLLVSWVLGALMTFVLYRRGKWRSKMCIRDSHSIAQRAAQPTASVGSPRNQS